jgi:hypothetical protein
MDTDSLSDVLLGTDADEHTDASTDVETWKARLRGKDQRLTAALQERTALLERAGAAEARAAELEEALSHEREKANGWYAEAMRHKYPRVASALPEGVNLDAAAMAALEDKFRDLEQARLAPIEDDDYTPRTDVNQPRRTYSAPKPDVSTMDTDQLREHLAGFSADEILGGTTRAAHR